MAKWVTHLMIADYILDRGMKLDEKGFCVGNIGPDCNIENEDWTEFVPSREVMHYMTEKDNKETIQADVFLRRHILDGEKKTEEEMAFLLGYYAHLITDIETVRYCHSGERIRGIYERLHGDAQMGREVEGKPESRESLKAVFGRRRMENDLFYIERDYLREHPQARFETILRKTKEFPEYLGFIPKGAVTRKLGVIDREYDFSNLGPTPEKLFFYPKEEFMRFVERTAGLVYDRLSQLPVAGIQGWA